MLRLNAIKKSYRSNLILDISALQLESNIYWIKGVNGSGKTTL
jgi:ABC-2 type transport system ATP-binding protein